MGYVRTVKTASGATAVQIVWSSRRGSRSIEHLGSAHDEVELAALKAAAAERLTAGQAVLDLGLAGPPGSEPLPITSPQMTYLWDGLCAVYRGPCAWQHRRYPGRRRGGFRPLRSHPPPRTD